MQRRMMMRRWKKPVIVERACGCEVSAYAPAEI
jgi:coenzyme PQQ precursor peptide PqqA